MALILLSMMGVREHGGQSASGAASIVHYAIAYVALFSLPLFGRSALRSALPQWVRLAALAGLFSSVIALVITVYPIIDVTSSRLYAAKICAVVVASNMARGADFRSGKNKRIGSRGSAKRQ